VILGLNSPNFRTETALNIGNNSKIGEPMAGEDKMKNLRSPWIPGQCRNQAGGSNSRPISDSLAYLAESDLPDRLRHKLELSKGATYADAVAQSLFLAALKGSVAAAREVREAIEGKSGPRPETAETKEVTTEGIIAKIRAIYGFPPEKNPANRADRDGDLSRMPS
jgi:hypothetical protein